MLTKTVRVTQTIRVTVDEAKFTPEFMAEFRDSMYHFTTLDDHLEHLGQLHARNIADNHDFIEGYGQADDMGISFQHVGGDQEIDS